MSKTARKHLALVFAVAGFSAVPATGQVLTGPTFTGSYVCALPGGTIVVREDSCDVSENVQIPDGLITGNATFSDTFSSTNFNGGTVQFNTVNVAFGGGSATFNNTVSFTGPSVTFSTPTTFQNPATFNGTTNFTAGMTTTNITNSGSITTGSLFGNNIFATDSFTVSAASTINMGNNIVSGVAAGVADTDAVNVAQLNAATSGITADVTALETTTATHTTQITALETTTATHTTQIATLNTNVGTLQTTVGTHTTQISALQAADTAFDTRIDSLEAITANLDERFDNAADRSDAGTATAVALSGAMFLPEKSFNLTGNVGAYRGAVAGALQLGALVSQSVALNAGVAHGLNKGGKTAVRAGFTIGW